MNTEDDTDENQSMTPNVTLIKSDFCSVYDNLCKKKKKREYEDFELRNVCVLFIIEYCEFLLIYFYIIGQCI